MSDIGFYGLAAVLTATGMAALAVLGLLVILVRRAMGKGTPQTWLGPVLYGLFAVLLAWVGSDASLPVKEWADTLSLPYALLASLAWIVVHRSVARPSQRHAPRP